jgi:threonine dehydrogenase-like Zn-dependent dehydrogenase
VRTFVVSAPGVGSVADVASPVAGAGEVLVEVERAGVCGTDHELFRGEIADIHLGGAGFPVRPGHEWVGRVRTVGAGVDPSLVGTRVTADTMIGCGICSYCAVGRHHLCPDHHEIGIKGDWHGALAEWIVVPVRAVHGVPEHLSLAAGALVEPGSNALRAVDAAMHAGEDLLVWGAGTIGLLCLAFGRQRGCPVTVVDPDPHARELAREFGAVRAVTPEELGDEPASFTASIDASTGVGVPSAAFAAVRPGGRVVLIGVAASPNPVDARLVVLRELTVLGVLGGSARLDDVIAAYASGAVRPDPLVGGIVSLSDLPAVFTGRLRPRGGPKIHVDPRL